MSVGSQNVYLNSNPSITFFRSVYRRYTNFATEAIAQTFNGRWVTRSSMALGYC